MTNRLAALAAVGFAIVSPVPAAAATVTITDIVDLDAPYYSAPGGFGYYMAMSTVLSPRVTLSQGDTLDLTLTFANNRTAQLTGPGIAIQPGLFDTSSVQGMSSGTSTLTLLNATGPVSPSITISGSFCCHGIVGNYYAGSILSAPGTIEFTGIRMVMTNLDFFGTPSISFGVANLVLSASSLSLGTRTPTGQVPEPGMIGLLGLGLVGVGLARRKGAAA